TRVSYFATDAAGNEETAHTLDVKIDGAPPVLSGLPSESCTIWPANHALQRVAVVRASDAVSGIARGTFQVNATSNEPMDPSDVAVTEDENGGLVVELRAERSGDSRAGRVYHVTVTAQDLAGNEATATATCIAPHDRGKGEERHAASAWRGVDHASPSASTVEPRSRIASRLSDPAPNRITWQA